MEFNTKENEQTPQGGGGPFANSKLGAKAEIVVKGPNGEIKHQSEVDAEIVDEEAVRELIEDGDDD